MNTRGDQNRRRLGPSMLVVLDVLLLLMILATAIHTIVVSRMRTLGPATKFQNEFWQQRTNELCVDRDQLGPAPSLSAGADPLEQLTFLGQLTPYSQKVWELYQSCQEPITREITEDLLHFKVDKFNEFEADTNVTAALRTIRAYVDESLATRRNQIYILGHTDDTADDKYNYAACAAADRRGGHRDRQPGAAASGDLRAVRRVHQDGAVLRPETLGSAGRRARTRRRSPAPDRFPLERAPAAGDGRELVRGRRLLPRLRRAPALAQRTDRDAPEPAGRKNDRGMVRGLVQSASGRTKRAPRPAAAPEDRRMG